jgi:hypothetical protein
MEPNRSPRRPRLYRWGALLAGAVVVAAAWRLTSRAQGPEGQAGHGTPVSSAAAQQLAPRPTPAPPFVPGTGLRRQVRLRESFVAYLASLRFDTSPYAADRQFLLQKVYDTLRVGPYAELAPEIGSALVEGAWADSGMVLARIVVPHPPYQPLRIVAETTFVCVRNARPGAAPQWALLIGVAGGQVVNSDSVRLTADSVPTVWRVGRIPTVARFKVEPRDDSACFPCDHVWCCAEGSM